MISIKPTLSFSAPSAPSALNHLKGHFQYVPLQQNKSYPGTRPTQSPLCVLRGLCGESFKNPCGESSSGALS